MEGEASRVPRPAQAPPRAPPRPAFCRSAPCRSALLAAAADAGGRSARQGLSSRGPENPPHTAEERKKGPAGLAYPFTLHTANAELRGGRGCSTSLSWMQASLSACLTLQNLHLLCLHLLRTPQSRGSVPPGPAPGQPLPAPPAPSPQGILWHCSPQRSLLRSPVASGRPHAPTLTRSQFGTWLSWPVRTTLRTRDGPLSFGFSTLPPRGAWDRAELSLSLGDEY